MVKRYFIVIGSLTWSAGLGLCQAPANPVPAKPPVTAPAGGPAGAHPGKVAPAAAAPAPVAPTPTTPAYELYSYYGDRYRDPFIPLVGQGQTDKSDHPPQTSSLSLKGIIQDGRGRMALLVSGTNSYILRGGRLYDGRNKMVKGMSGVIKHSSVVIIGADREVRELKVQIAAL